MGKLYKAWRDILHKDEHWEAHDVFKKSIASRFSAKENSKKANILLLGKINSGKSSLINSVLSVSAGRIVHSAYVGTSDYSFTTKYGKYTDSHFFKNFILHDCMGLEEMDGKGFHVNDLVHIVQGNISKEYQFNPLAPIAEDDKKFVKDPPPEDKVHCVIFCIDATTIINDRPREIKKIWELQDKLKEMDVPRLLCLTKIDKLCEKVDNDLKKTFYSVKVRNVVQTASEIFKIQPGFVHPIKNYEKEVDTNILVDMLLINPLRQALDFTTDYINKQD